MWGKSALLQSFADLFLLFLDYFLNLILQPKIVSLQKGRMTRNKVSFVMLDDWFKSAFGVDFAFREFMLLHKLFLVFETLIIEILPDWFNLVIFNVFAFFGVSVFVSRRGTKILLSEDSFGRLDELLIGLEVLLLIKIHFI